MLNKLAGSVGSGIGVGLGLGAALGAVTALQGDLRPVLRGAIKGGVAVYELSGRAVAVAREQVEDLYHEAQAEREVERGARQSSAARQRSSGEKTVFLPRQTK